MKAEETVDYHIKSAWHAISRMYNVFSTPHDMTMAIGYVLLNIDKKGTPATKIAPALGLEARSLTRMLKSLEEKNWIRREIDSQDKRVVNVYLTEIGKTKRDLARKAVLEFNNAVLGTVSKEKISDMIDTIGKVSKVVEAINIEHKSPEIEEVLI